MTKNEFIHKVNAGQYVFLYVGDGLSVTFGFSNLFDKYFVRFSLPGEANRIFCSQDVLCRSYFSLIENLIKPKIEII